MRNRNTAILKSQKFGVEIEFTGITRRKAANIVANVLGSTASAVGRDVYKTQTIIDAQGRKWKITRDGSIMPQGGSASDEYRVEFVTPPLNYGDIETLQQIVRALKAEGAFANSSCGIHVHVDGANHNAASLRRLVKFFTARQELIYEGLKISPSRAERWCCKIPHTLIDEMAKRKNISRDEAEAIWYSSANTTQFGATYRGRIDHQHYNPTRYHGLNLHSFFSKGTVEFRLFNSTLHAGKVKAYVQFCLAVSAFAIVTVNNMGIFQKADMTNKADRAKLWMNTLTNRLDLDLDEFKTCRLHMMAGFADEVAAAA